MKHFCASAFVIDPLTKKVLLVHHKKFNKWNQPGGHIEDNETPEETAIREVYEETGLNVNIVPYEIEKILISTVASNDNMTIFRFDFFTNYFILYLLRNRAISG